MIYEKPIPDSFLHRVSDKALWTIVKLAGQDADDARADGNAIEEMEALTDALDAHRVLAYRNHGGRRCHQEARRTLRSSHAVTLSACRGSLFRASR